MTALFIRPSHLPNRSLTLILNELMPTMNRDTLRDFARQNNIPRGRNRADTIANILREVNAGKISFGCNMQLTIFTK